MHSKFCCLFYREGVGMSGAIKVRFKLQKQSQYTEESVSMFSDIMGPS